MRTSPCPTSQHPDRQLNGPLPPLPRMDPNDRVLDRLDAAPTTAPRTDHQRVGKRCSASGIAGMTKLSPAQGHDHQNDSRHVCQLHLFTVSLQLPFRNETDFAYLLEMMRSSLTLTNPPPSPASPSTTTGVCSRYSMSPATSSPRTRKTRPPCADPGSLMWGRRW